jgi:hypothetical protein
MATATKARRRGKLAVVDEHQQQLQTAMAGMSEEMIECRDLQHSWRKWATHWLPKDREYERQLKCLRCSTIRVQRLSERGLLLGSSYLYVEGYLVKGMGRLSADDKGTLRLASILDELKAEANA